MRKSSTSNLTELYQSALLHQSKGDLDGAINAYKRILKQKHDLIEVLCNLGGVLHQKGMLSEAIEYYRDALDINHNLPQIHLNLAVALQAIGQPNTASEHFNHAISLKPDYIEAHFRIGMLDIERGRYRSAFERFEHILQYDPNNHDVLNSAAICLKNLGDHALAIRYLQQALTLRPNHFQALANLAAAQLAQGKWNESIQTGNRALSINPSEPKLHYNLGIAYKQQKRFDIAATCFRTALAIEPSAAYAKLELAHTLQSTCDWQDDAYSLKSIAHLIQSILNDNADIDIDPFSALSWPICLTSLKRVAEKHAKPIESRSAQFKKNLNPHEYSKNERLRIGYLSPDYRNHPAIQLMGGLFNAHDRNTFEVTAYSIGPDDGSIYRRRVEAEAENFIDLYEENLEECINRIRTDRINVLIDLAGYTTGARPEIFMARSAPIQVNYLGFAGTLGSNCFDYLITDTTITPPEFQSHFTEKFAYLAHCYQINDDRDVATDNLPARQEYQLPEDAFIFCCFNNNYKIDPGIFRTWMVMLSQVPGSVLWLLKGSELQMHNLRREAAHHGVAPERLVFAEPVDKATHLARHTHADLFLDTLYYNAHTTGSDALRQGVPMITCQGNTFASRVGSSLLHAVGLDELVTTDLEQYIAKAVRLAKDPERMNAVRNKLRSNLPTTSLLDNPGFARSLERLYEIMWRRFAQGEALRQIGTDDTA